MRTSTMVSFTLIGIILTFFFACTFSENFKDKCRIKGGQLIYSMNGNISCVEGRR